MSNIVKVLGQVMPTAGDLNTLYAVPLLTRTTVSSLVICNQDAADSTFRVSAAVGNAPNTATQYLYYDQTLEGHATFIATVGITLAPTDNVRVSSANGLMSFNLFGVEVS